MAEKIGDWTPTFLTKYIQDAMKSNPPQFTISQTIEKLTCTSMLSIVDQVQVGRSSTTVGAAGGATALPATPVGYFEILDPGGVVRKVPYYNA